MPAKFSGITGLLTNLGKIPHLGMDMVSQVPVKFEDIIMFSNNSKKLKSHYIWFKTKDGHIYYVKYSLTGIYKHLPDYFARINEHEIINFTAEIFQGRINGRRIKFDDSILKITDTYKSDFEKRFYQYFLPPNHHWL